MTSWCFPFILMFECIISRSFGFMVVFCFMSLLVETGLLFSDSCFRLVQSIDYSFIIVMNLLLFTI